MEKGSRRKSPPAGCARGPRAQCTISWCSADEDVAGAVVLKVGDAQAMGVAYPGWLFVLVWFLSFSWLLSK